jgi:hypothetical protein
MQCAARSKCKTRWSIAGWRKTQFLHRDAAQVDANEAALRADGLPQG